MRKIMMKELSLITTAILMFATGSALACSCMKTELGAKYNEASMVFLGHITIAKEITNDPEVKKSKSANYIEATYKVIEVFKGKPVDGGSIIDGVYTGGSCAVGMLPGVDYIIFNNANNSVSICNGTKFYNSVKDVELINKLRVLHNNGG